MNKFLKASAIIFAVITLALGTTLLFSSDGLKASAETAETATLEVINDSAYPWAYDTATNTYSTTNVEIAKSTTTLTVNVISAGNLPLSYLTSTEKGYDEFTITVTKNGSNPTAYGPFSGYEVTTYTDMTIEALKIGDKIEFTYTKDSGVDTGDDKVYLRFPTDSIVINADISVKGNGKVTYNGSTDTTFKIRGKVGDSIVLTATPEEGYNFAFWTNGNLDVLSKESVYTAVLSGSTSIIAVFASQTESQMLIKSINGKPTFRAPIGEEVLPEDANSTVYRVDMSACPDQTAKMVTVVTGATYLTFSSMASTNYDEFLTITVDGIQRFSDGSYESKDEVLADLSYELHTIKILGDGLHIVEIEFNEIERWNGVEEIRGAREVRIKNLLFTTTPETIDVQFNFDNTKGSLWLDLSGVRALGGGAEYLLNIANSVETVAIPKGMQVYLLANANKDYTSSIDKTQNTSSKFNGFYNSKNENIGDSNWLDSNGNIWYDTPITFYDYGIKGYDDHVYECDPVITTDIREIALTPYLVECEKIVEGEATQNLTIQNGDCLEVPFNVKNSFRFRITDYPGLEGNYKALVNGKDVNVEKIGDEYGFLLSDIMDMTEISITYLPDGYYESAPLNFTILPTISGTIEQNIVDKNFADSIQAVVNTDEKPWIFNPGLSTAEKIAYSSNIKGINSGVNNIGFTVKGSGVFQFDYMVSSEANYDLICIKVGSPLVSGDKNEANCIGGSKATAGGEVSWTTSSLTISQGDDETTTIYIAYLKDSSGNKGSDLAAIANVKFLQGNAIVNYSSSSAGGSAVVTLNGSAITSGREVAVGTELTYTATVNDGYKFYGWYNNGILVSLEKSYTTALTADVNYVAVIEQFGTYPVSMNGALYTSLNEALQNATEGSVITLNENLVMTESVTIPEGVTLLLPYAVSDTVGTAVGTTSNASARVSWLNESKYLYLTFTVNGTLTVNGSLVVGGVQHYPDQSGQGHTSGAYSQIINNGNIIVNGTLQVYGLIKGNGSITVESSAKVYQPFVVLNFSGGTNTYDLYGADQFPFVQFATINIQCNQTVKYGAKVYGMTSLYFFSSVTQQDVVLIDDIANINGSEGSLIWLAEGSYAELSYSDASVKQAVGNINLTEYGLTTVKIHGNVTAGNFHLQGYGSKNMVLAIPYTYNFVLCNGSNVTMQANYGYKIMPGANFTVEEGATLNVESGAKLYVYDALIQSDKSSKIYPDASILSKYGFAKNGNLIVNGTLNISGEFAGIIQTDGSGIINLSETATVGAITVTDGSEGGYTNNKTQFTLISRVYGLYGFVNLEAGKVYKGFASDGFVLETFTADSAARCDNLTVTLNQSLKGRFLEWDGESYISEVKAYIGVAKEGVGVNLGGVTGTSDKDGNVNVVTKISQNGKLTYFTTGYNEFAFEKSVICDQAVTLEKVVSAVTVDTSKEGTVTLREYADNGTIAQDFALYAVVSYYAYDSEVLPLTIDESTLTGYINNATVQVKGLTFTVTLKIDTAEMAQYRTAAENLKNSTSETLIADATALWHTFTEMKKSLSAKEMAFVEERLKSANVYAGEIATSASVLEVVYGDTSAEATLNFVNGKTEVLTANYNSHGKNYVNFTVSREYKGIKYALSANAKTVTPCQITVAIIGATSVYGDEDSVLTSSTEGLKYDDTAQEVYTLSRAQGRNVSAYDITGQSINPNYRITFVNGENAYTITAREVSLTIADHTNIMESTAVIGDIEVSANKLYYGDKLNYTFKIYNADGAVVATVDQNGNLSSALTKGSYYIEADTDNKNYKATCVKKGEITVVEENDYYSVVVKFFNGDKEVTSHVYDGSVIDYTVTVTVKDTGETVTQGVTVGDLVIKNAGNYSVNVTVNDVVYTGIATFTVEKLQLTLAVLNETLVYNGEISAPEIIATNLVKGDAVTVISASTSNRTVGSYTLTASEIQGSASNNYKLPEDATVSYQIVQRPITVIINEAESVYGEPISNLTATLYEDSVLGTGDNFNSLFTLSVNAVNVGSYDILGESKNDNYDITFIGGEKAYTVTERPITLGVNNVTKTYGEEEAELSISGIVEGSLVGNDNLDGMYRLVREKGINVGSYKISGMDDSDNYSISFTSATYTIEKRPITVLVNDVAQIYGEKADYAYTVTSGSLCYDDSVNGLISAAREQGLTVGEYAITATVNEGINYAVTVSYTNTDKSLYTIEKRPVTLTLKDVSVENTVKFGELNALMQNAYTLENILNGDNLKVEVYALVANNRLTAENFARLFAGGNHLLTASYQNDNYEVTIQGGTLYVSLPKVSVKNIVNSFVYSGEEISAFSLSNVQGALESATENTFRAVYYKEGEETPLDSMLGAGKYRMVIEIVNADAYVWADGAQKEFTVTVDKKDVSEAVQVIKDDKQYVVKRNGLNIPATVNGYDVNVEVTYALNGQTVASLDDFGYYTMTVTVVDDNYKGSTSVNFYLVENAYVRVRDIVSAKTQIPALNGEELVNVIKSGKKAVESLTETDLWQVDDNLEWQNAITFVNNEYAVLVKVLDLQSKVTSAGAEMNKENRLLTLVSIRNTLNSLTEAENDIVASHADYEKVIADYSELWANAIKDGNQAIKVSQKAYSGLIVEVMLAIAGLGSIVLKMIFRG